MAFHPRVCFMKMRLEHTQHSTETAPCCLLQPRKQMWARGGSAVVRRGRGEEESQWLTTTGRKDQRAVVPQYPRDPRQGTHILSPQNLCTLLLLREMASYPHTSHTPACACGTFSRLLTTPNQHT